jgi:hypothetical protein
MDFGKAFSFVFEDEDWVKKIAVGGLFSLIPVIGIFVVLGWGMEIIKRVINGDAEVLPDWSDFGGYLSRGFMAFVIAFVFFLPVILIQSCGTGLPFLTESSDQDVLITAVWILTACFTCFTILYSIVVYMVLPAAIARYAATGEVGAAFKLGEVFKMVKNNLGTYAMVLLGGILASMVASLGSIACVIGVLFTTVYSFAINGHLWGQAYNVSGSGTALDSAEPVPAAD